MVWLFQNRHYSGIQRDILSLAMHVAHTSCQISASKLLLSLLLFINVFTLLPVICICVFACDLQVLSDSLLSGFSLVMELKYYVTSSAFYILDMPRE